MRIELQREMGQSIFISLLLSPLGSGIIFATFRGWGKRPWRQVRFRRWNKCANRIGDQELSSLLLISSLPEKILSGRIAIFYEILSLFVSLTNIECVTDWMRSTLSMVVNLEGSLVATDAKNSLKPFATHDEPSALTDSGNWLIWTVFDVLPVFFR